MATSGGHQRAVFLDRDGVINRLLTERGPRETPCTAQEVELLPRAGEALSALRSAGFVLLVVTNQPNVAKGKSTPQDYADIEHRINELLGLGCVPDAVYACQHHPDPRQVVVPELLMNCECRKPKPGLVQRGLADFQLDPTKCWLVGDADSDLQAGVLAGIPTTHLIYVGSKCNTVATCVPNVWDASQYILANQG